MKIHAITSNPGKFAEIKRHLPDVEQLDIDLDEIQSLDIKKIVEHKLVSAREHHAGELIVDDVSVELDGMNGFPGHLIKWMNSALGPDGFYNVVKNLPIQTASVICVIGYIDNADTIHTFEGKTEGKIVQSENTATDGFGWDSLFMPDGATMSFGEMSPTQKQKFSHRAKALHKFTEF